MKIKILLQLLILIFPLISLGDNLIEKCEEEFINIFDNLVGKPVCSFENPNFYVLKLNSQKAIDLWKKKKKQCSIKGLYNKKLTQLQCQVEFNSLWQDETLNTFDQKIESFYKLKTKCSVEGVFEGHLADLYLMYNFDVARNLLLTAISNKKYTDTRYLEAKLAHLEYKSGNVKELYKTASKIIEKYPNWWAGYYYLGLHYVVHNNFVQAENLFFKALKIREDVNVYIGLAAIFYEYEDYKKVIEFYRKGLAINAYQALLATRPSAAVIIAFIKENDLRPAKAIIDLEEKNNKEAAQKNYAYQIARKYYEDTVRTGTIPDKDFKIELDPPGYSVPELRSR